MQLKPEQIKEVQDAVADALNDMLPKFVGSDRERGAGGSANPVTCSGEEVTAEPPASSSGLRLKQMGMLTMPPPLRGYYVCERGAEWGIPVVAPSTREARRIGFSASELDCDWIDLRCKWQRDANVDGLPVGIVEDVMDALRRGLYQWLEGGTCDICGAKDTYLESMNGNAVCEACLE